jgi:hypothetical protein
MKRLLFLFLGLSSLAVVSSCKKVEGQGGTSSIKGVVVEQKYIGTNIVAEYVAADQDVYIIYGTEGTFYDDDVKTSYDGSFEFNYLNKGNYRLFVYEDSSTEPSGKAAKFVEVEIVDKKSTIEVDTIYIKKI